MATADVIDKLVKSLRIATWLKECKLEALAGMVAPTNEQIAGVVMHYLEKQPDGRSLLWEVLAAVTSSVEFYQIGFRDSAAPLQASMGDGFCKDVTEKSNEILRERKGAK